MRSWCYSCYKVVEYLVFAYVQPQGIGANSRSNKAQLQFIEVPPVAATTH